MCCLSYAKLVLVLVLTVNCDVTTTVTTETTVDAVTTTAEAVTTSATAATSTTPAKECVPTGDLKDICHYSGTDEECDICEGVICGDQQECMKKPLGCAFECRCSDVGMKLSPNGTTCISVCSGNPCNKGNCSPDANSTLQYSCECPPEYDGKHCQHEHDFCLDEQPANCPLGAFECQMFSAGNYTCKCAEGHWKNSNGTCVKIEERVRAVLHFYEIPYAEAYNDENRNESVHAKLLIANALRKMFNDSLIAVRFTSFTQGSLISHIELDLQRPLLNASSNEKTFRQHVLDCNELLETGGESCFGSLGRVFLPLDAWLSYDQSCIGIICPRGTKCEGEKDNLLMCVCEKGFNYTGISRTDAGLITEMCTDTDECQNSPCGDHQCVNKEGSFYCDSPCYNVTCPGSSSCVPSGGTAYNCECPWIFAGAACSFPWTLIFLLLFVLFLLTTVGALVYVFVFLRKSRANLDYARRGIEVS